MEKNLEEKLVIPSPVLTLEESSQRNPLFQKTLSRIKNPREREAFLGMFRQYLLDAYQNNPRMNRLMKTHDLAEKVEDAPEIDNYDTKDIVDAQLYSEPGRSYQYTNNLSGYERKKKGLLKRLYHTTKDFTFETLPGIVGLGGWYGASKWHTKRLAEEAAKEALAARVVKKGIGAVGGAFKDMAWWEYNPVSMFLRLDKGVGAAATGAAGEVVGQAATNASLGALGMVLSPAKYLLGGYFLYKTIKYFMKKYKERKELKEMNKQVWMQNQMLAQRV